MNAGSKFSQVIVILALLVLAACSQVSPTPTPAPPTATPSPDVTVCASGCDYTTIQAAIDAAGTGPAAVIAMRDPVHTEAGIEIHQNVTIRGEGQSGALTIVQAHAEPETATERVFTVPAGVTVTLQSLTIRHGNPRQSPESGGGILNEGTLRLENCVITANNGSAGGGIHSDGTLTVVDSTISYNTARGGKDKQYECSTGGGIKNLSGTVTLINSTVNNNTAVGRGGGFHIACQGILVLENSTISGNFTNQDGGGVYLNGVGYFTQVTISDNDAKTGGGVYIHNREPRNTAIIHGHLSYTNTLIANNRTRMDAYGVADCMMGDGASLGANSNNLVGDGTCSPAYSGDASLLPLADNGGRSQTHALGAGSPAQDRIPADACPLATDQRGEVRTAPCDIGAIETQGSP